MQRNALPSFEQTTLKTMCYVNLLQPHILPDYQATEREHGKEQPTFKMIHMGMQSARGNGINVFDEHLPNSTDPKEGLPASIGA
jgi:hypothetical protein